MAKSTSVIEINGNRYDAITGQMIGTVKRVAYQVKKTPSGVIDGFTKNVGTITPKIMPSQRAAHPSSSEPAQKVHNRTQKSSTLMRSAVPKPTANSHNDSVKKHLSTSEVAKINHARASRANAFHKSSKVQRFGIFNGNHEVNDNSKHKSQVPAKINRPEQGQDKTASTTVQSSGSSANISSQQLERLLDHALVRADAHKRAFKGQGKRGFFDRISIMPKWAAVGASFLVVVMVAGFFAWQNIPQVSMRVAATRADIPASVPSYTPSGFSFEGPIGYSGGAVSIKFKANTDKQRAFMLTQQKSDWTTETLAANTVPDGSQVQTSQVKGTTVYIYGDQENRATWVDKGVRYTLIDKANLNSDQILKIAGSL